MNRKARRALGAKNQKAQSRAQTKASGPAAILEAAMAKHQAGDLKSAEALYKKIPSKAAEAGLANRYLGAVYLQAGAPQRALEPLQKAITALPDEPEPRLHLALAFEALGQVQNALDAATGLQALVPDTPSIEAMIGRLLVLDGRFDDACARFERALTPGSETADLLQQYAFALDSAKRRAEAVTMLEKAIFLDPDHVASLINLSSLRLAEDTVEAAEQALIIAKRAIALAPQEEAALNNLGVALNALDRYSETVDLLQAFESRATLPTKATALWRLGHLEDAITATEKAIELGGADPKLLWRLSLYYLHMERYEEAARLEDAGFDCGERGEDRRGDGPMLSAETSSKLPPTARILIWPEQGIGDVIRFAAWLTAPKLAAYDIVLECEPRLSSLLTRAFPHIKVSDQRCDGTGFDGHAPIGALPALTQRWTPKVDGYLKPSPDLEAEMQAWLNTVGSGKKTKKIGFIWGSGLQQLRRRFRFAPPEVWGHALQQIKDAAPETVFINLSYHNTEEDERIFDAQYGIALQKPPGIDMKNDLETVVALTASLDAVIGIGVSGIEFAGAVGIPNFHVAPEYAAQDRAHPVYASGRLFYRRAGETDWRGVLDRATEALLLHLER